MPSNPIEEIETISQPMTWALYSQESLRRLDCWRYSDAEVAEVVLRLFGPVSLNTLSPMKSVSRRDYFISTRRSETNVILVLGSLSHMIDNFFVTLPYVNPGPNCLTLHHPFLWQWLSLLTNQWWTMRNNRVCRPPAYFTRQMLSSATQAHSKNFCQLTNRPSPIWTLRQQMLSRV